MPRVRWLRVARGLRPATCTVAEPPRNAVGDVARRMGMSWLCVMKKLSLITIENDGESWPEIRKLLLQSGFSEEARAQRQQSPLVLERETASAAVSSLRDLLRESDLEWDERVRNETSDAHRRAGCSRAGRRGGEAIPERGSWRRDGCARREGRAWPDRSSARALGYGRRSHNDRRRRGRPRGTRARAEAPG